MSLFKTLTRGIETAVKLPFAVAWDVAGMWLGSQLGWLLLQPSC